MVMLRRIWQVLYRKPLMTFVTVLLFAITILLMLVIGRHAYLYQKVIDNLDRYYPPTVRFLSFDSAIYSKEVLDKMEAYGKEHESVRGVLYGSNHQITVMQSEVIEKRSSLRFEDDLTLNFYVLANQIELVEGEFPSEEQSGFLLNESTAAELGLKLGDVLQIEISELAINNLIIGIYRPTDHAWSTPHPNDVFFATGDRQLSAYFETNTFEFVLDSHASTAGFLNYLSKADFDRDIYTFYVSNEPYIEMIVTLINLTSSTSYMLTFAIHLISIIFIWIIVALYRRNYIRDANVYSILGLKRGLIIRQFCIQTLILLLIALALSFITFSAARPVIDREWHALFISQNKELYEQSHTSSKIVSFLAGEQSQQGNLIYPFLIICEVIAAAGTAMFLQAFRIRKQV